jgi:hypothetical protein
MLKMGEMSKGGNANDEKNSLFASCAGLFDRFVRLQYTDDGG